VTPENAIGYALAALLAACALCVALGATAEFLERIAQ
jgi:hypothetical protein